MSLFLQQCTVCETVQYPTRDVCVNCLAGELTVQSQSGTGELLSISALHHSLDHAMAQQLPWVLASVKLDCGPVVLAHLTDTAITAGSKVEVTAQEQANGSSLLQARPLSV